MWDHPDSLIFVAAGNSGDDGVGTVGTPATNKNGVAVGATLNAMESFQAYDLLGSLQGKKEAYDESSLASFSSRGPTKDGRLKPEICGVGTIFVIFLVMIS
jgi:serine protease AprX